MLYAVILAGGKGTRLYPLSRTDNPKQFLNIIDEKSFLRSTVDRIKPFVDKENIYVVTNKSYYDKICDEVPELEKEHIFQEPSNKETATCIGLSAVKLLKKDANAVMVVLPSDHYVGNNEAFNQTIQQAADIASKRKGLVTIGVNPTRPETGYGYIQMGEKIGGELPSYRVERFLEKPNLEVAKDLLTSGKYLWNSGIFVWRVDSFLKEMERYLPKMHSRLMTIYRNLGEENEQEIIEEQYNAIDGISVDFGIMQKTRRAYVVKSEFAWDDIGSYAALGRFLKNFRGNNVKGTTFMEQSEGCSVFAKNKLIIGFGVKDLVIVDTDDVMLVMDKSKDQEIKDLFNKLKEDEAFSKFL
ncbi:mannose-1-phosphate guanylyltransferase [Clostridium collagenovorans DSM 3089]|uniref:mannose-1-phosphate guanylyltransferase n=1 Tax=Clostridium collagenovorans DSM 3089 TaxID=1121306 RepID=A0A1M5W5B6_9CLOT|nr:mannose-1-phosphate guanylyltransferase [Clostridium collagenovorans]SHH82628.1 mannose-1-phosphate guanylyltransferase [Clostridium collagenovorans DSM 3089]